MESLSSKLYCRYQHASRLPHRDEVLLWVEELLAFLFPERLQQEFSDEAEFSRAYVQFQLDFECLLSVVFAAAGDERSPATIREQFELELPAMIEVLQDDLVAIERGDPAAKSRLEIIATYPGFYAIALHRIAHLLESLEVPLLPRVLSEFASGRTGIELHPSAKIGRFFCIDHGGGVVVGETSVIGEHVKLYQGVTLGALSVDKSMADIKRHPTIEDRVVIYAGATILGGDTVVGADSIIGGNVWLTHSVPHCSRVYHQPEINIKQATCSEEADNSGL
ncbi:MAG: serine O-acetyltransferase [Pseudohongiellaceae bacterium]|jgi:serine O-acetyltransferase